MLTIRNKFKTAFNLSYFLRCDEIVVWFGPVSKYKVQAE
jgi:hypothetical protein